MTDPAEQTFLDSLAGLPLAEATRLAEERGHQVRALTPGSPMTMDYRPERVNLEHEPGLEDAPRRVLRAFSG
ncbi:I78 family peptidase inhibitor [Nocardioides sp. GY 10127]|uniref:I78 family peptidase inhibitor n=1 Tax=Nocardioides sp. GY 10127 TaxID=2569762 RepID=UPI0010A7714B|nr:I78 family peptidase inhibitor [Nocardioides sp. GY 10127]TIC80159.1 hypothetical protein E8D37_16335 [Nocardioides sp. GY 10127]